MGKRKNSLEALIGVFFGYSDLILQEKVFLFVFIHLHKISYALIK